MTDTLGTGPARPATAAQVATLSPAAVMSTAAVES
jgi:hypothetical protein